MTVAELIKELEACENKSTQVVISKVPSDFNVVSIKEVKIGEEGPVYIRTNKN